MTKKTSIIQDIFTALSFFGVPAAGLLLLVGSGWENKLFYPGTVGIGLWIIGLLLWKHFKYGWIVSLLGICILAYLYLYIPIRGD